MGEFSEPSVFDLRGLNAALDRSKRRYAIISTTFIAILSGFGLVLLVAGWLKVASGSGYPVEVIALLGGGLWSCLLVVMVACGLRWTRPGAESVSTDSKQIELRYRKRPPSLIVWGDPNLRFELRDYSSTPAGSRSVDVRYTLLLKGRQTALSEESYRAILEQIRTHGLLDAVGSAPWWSPDSATVHRVHAALR
jgi:hypothetical protein